MEHLHTARKFLEEKLAELKVKLEESEKALVAYARQRANHHQQVAKTSSRWPILICFR